MIKNKSMISALLVFSLLMSGCSGLTVGLNSNTNTAVPVAEDQEDLVQAVPTATVVPPNPAAEPASLEGLQESLKVIYENVNPSVVNLRVVQKTTVANFPSIPGLPFGNPEDQPSQEFRQEGQGSGFIWDKEGHIVTNNHVVENADQVTVTFSDGISVEGRVVGKDPDSDLAVIQVNSDSSELTPVKLADSTQADVGQIVIAIGNPFGLEGTMTFGIISGLGRSLPVGSQISQGASYTIPDIIQTDAPINPGNSGGVLVNIEGHVLGVTTAIESSTRSNAGIGYVVPSATIQKVVPSLIETGSYLHSWLGISGLTLSPTVNEAAGLKTDQRGVLVIEVTSGSPAEKANLQGSDRTVDIDGREATVGGDVVISIDQQPVYEFEDLVTYLARSTVVGQKVTLTILRESQEQKVDVTLAARPKTEQKIVKKDESPRTSSVWLGIQGFNLIPQINKAMGLAEDQNGVLIIHIEPKSPADKANLRGSFKSFTLEDNRIMIGGDVITAVDGTAIQKIDDLQSEINRQKAGDEITLTILRDKSEIEIKVTLEERPAE